MTSKSEFGMIKSFAANTHPGNVQIHNEDRVTIIINMKCPSSKDIKTWPKVSYFAIYDGHNGTNCADFLKQKLYKLICQQDCFPSDPINAIKQGCHIAE